MGKTFLPVTHCYCCILNVKNLVTRSQSLKLEIICCEGDTITRKNPLRKAAEAIRRMNSHGNQKNGKYVMQLSKVKVPFRQYPWSTLNSSKNV